MLFRYRHAVCKISFVYRGPVSIQRQYNVASRHIYMQFADTEGRQEGQEKCKRPGRERRLSLGGTAAPKKHGRPAGKNEIPTPEQLRFRECLRTRNNIQQLALRGADAASLVHGPIADRQKGPCVFLFLLVILDGRLNKAHKQRMGLVGAAFEFRVELDAHEKILVRQFDGFYQPSVRGQAGKA